MILGDAGAHQEAAQGSRLSVRISPSFSPDHRLPLGGAFFEGEKEEAIGSLQAQTKSPSVQPSHSLIGACSSNLSRTTYTFGRR